MSALTEMATLLADQLAGLDTLEARLALVARTSTGRVAFSTSLGREDQAIWHAIAATQANVDVFTLDTGRHFPQTLDVIAANEARYVQPIRIVAPDADALAALVAADGIHGFRRSVAARHACCHVRKVAPLNRALAGAAIWITGLRRAQSTGRGATPFAEVDAALGLIKVNPLADWDDARLERYLTEHDVPVNVLHAQGFASIGCQPCTRAVGPGEDVRAGRWWWEQDAAALELDGKECGLHSRPRVEGIAS
jgi:phosphoadenosine phosphosulfate reductase